MRFIITSLFVLLSSFQCFSGVINVQKFGARGNGKSDDTKAIQAAINAASETSIDTVYFPAGTYLIGSYTTTRNYLENYCLHIHSGIIFQGNKKNSLILIANNLFNKPDSMANAHLFYGVNIDNVKFLNLSINMNGKNNLVPKNIIKNNSAIFIDNGSNIIVKNITIKNCAGRNMIILKGTGSKALIQQSTFLNGGNYVGSATPNKYQTDFSFIYTEWDSSSVINNHIEQQNVDIALSAYTGGIEIHGSYSNASANTIIGCYPAVYITSSWHPMEKTSVENNQMLKCLKGISFWVNYKMNDIVIRGNNIELTSNNSLKPEILAGIMIPNGNMDKYGFKFANNAPLTNILITENTISSKLADTNREKTVGMILHSLQKSTISNNVISGMNYGGVILQGSKWGLDSLIVLKNKFIDFNINNDTLAVGGYVIITDTYSPKIKTAPGIKNVIFLQNEFIRNKKLSQNIKDVKSRGRFFGAFVALPGNMINEIHFEGNRFSESKEKVYFVKTE